VAAQLITILLKSEDTMRFAYLIVAITILVVGAIWQVRADQGAKKNVSPEVVGLIQHGEYLVSRVAHCSDCHTPRDAKGEFDNSKLLQGTSLGVVPKQKTDAWADESPDITGDGLAGEWSEDEMIKFFTSGVNPQGDKPTPPMPIFHLHEKDARAITLYLKSLSDVSGSGDSKKKSKRPN
jgi:mono/diheme cytochrome c family protein